MNILIIHGPNLNRLSKREKSVYGTTTLDELNHRLCLLGDELGVGVTCIQSNIEGELINLIHASEGQYDFLILNPGAYTHYSYAIRDAISSVDVPVIEVHLSNTLSRENFRKESVIAPVCIGQIMGLGPLSYELALQFVKTKMQEKEARIEYAGSN